MTMCDGIFIDIVGYCYRYCWILLLLLLDTVIVIGIVIGIEDILLQRLPHPLPLLGQLNSLFRTL